jgi:hypothetical protein
MTRTGRKVIMNPHVESHMMGREGDVRIPLGVKLGGG